MNFFDKKLESKFKDDGFVVCDVFNKDEIITLRQLYSNNRNAHLVDNGNTHNTCDTKNQELVKHIDESISEILRPRLDSILSSYDFMLSSYMVKEPGKGNITGFHQDPTLIDQKDKISANVWIPLQDTDTSNGCLQFVRGSHRLGNILVVTPNFPTIFEKFSDQLSYFVSNVPLKAGQGVFFDNRLIHGATPNQSESERIAVVAALKSDKCDWVYYYMDQETKMVEKYHIDYETYTKYPKDIRPDTPLLDEFKFNFEQISYSDFKSFMLKNYPFETLKNLAKKRIKPIKA